METLHVYRTILANGSLRRVLAAFLAFNTQENGVWIAIVVYAYDQGGAATAGLVAVAQLIPSAIVAPLGAVIGDRMRRDRALSLGYLIQAIANGGVALALVVAPPLVVYAAAVVAACAITLTRPVHHALLPELADTPQQLTAANSVSSSMEGLGMLLGPFVAAAILVTAGPGAVLAVFACTSAAGAALSLGLRLHETPVEPGEAAEPEALVGDAIGGLLELRREPGAPTLTVLGASQFFVLGALDVFYALLAIDVLGVGEHGAGLLASAVGVGGLIGAASTAVLIGRRQLAPAILGGLLVMGVGLAAVAGASSFALAIVLLALCGAGRSFFDVAARTLLQRSVKDEVLARVFGVQEALIMIVLAIGSASVPILVGVFGERGAFLAAGTAMPVFGLMAFRALRTADRLADVPDPEKVEFLLAIPLFRPLPYRVVEQLARALAPRFVEAGRHVIREGEVGDRFYILTTGEAVVRSAGREVAHLGAGGYAGEIALLRDVPRTASVIAVTDVHLLSLEREEFLGAILGHRPSVQVAHQEVERRLADLHDPSGDES